MGFDRINWLNLQRPFYAPKISILSYGDDYKCFSSAINKFVKHGCTQIYKNDDSSANNSILYSWGLWNNASLQMSPSLLKISKKFRLCDPLICTTDYDYFLRWARNAFVRTATFNYPYPAKGLEAFPVKKICELLDAEDSPASGLLSACGVSYNASGNAKCFNIYQEYHYCADVSDCGKGPDSNSWDYQACTEVNLEGDSNGVEDMFPVLPFNSSMRDEYCHKTWNVTPRRNWLMLQYSEADISSSSNIVFSNGNLDPWERGGVLHNVSDSVVAIRIENAAHHLDLRAPNPADPQSVNDARDFEKSYISKWIEEFNAAGNAASTERN